MAVWVTILGFVAGYVLLALARALYFHYVTSRRKLVDQPSGTSDKVEITLEELAKYNGMDPYRPLALAVRGTIYDVRRGVEFYGPGKAYGVYAGREVSRSLAKMSLEEQDCNGDLSDLTEKEMGVLEQWESKFAAKYPVLGHVVPSLVLNHTSLAEYDGTDENKPMILSIRGMLFDVSSAKAFYGPSGAYPFAGRECARALAKYSVDVKDCTDDLEDCSISEMDALRSWEAQFQSKYKIVGRLTSEEIQ